MNAFHTFRVRDDNFAPKDFELFSMVLSALEWRRHNGSITLITDRRGEAIVRQRGLVDAWNRLETTLDKIDALGIDENIFWAGTKLVALSTQSAPCVMIDLDFILWRSIDFDAYGNDLATIHREDINNGVYPPRDFFYFRDGWSLPSWLDWTTEPCNGSLVYFGSDALIRRYTEFALEFMQHAEPRGGSLEYMVFAEQRWLSMCARRMKVPIHELSTLGELFSERQKYFTHLWGFKDRLRNDPALEREFCLDCARRLQHDFPEYVSLLQKYGWTNEYFQPSE